MSFLNPAKVQLRCNQYLLRVNNASGIYQTLEISGTVNQELVASENSLRVVGDKERESLVH